MQQHWTMPDGVAYPILYALVTIMFVVLGWEIWEAFHNLPLAVWRWAIAGLIVPSSILGFLCVLLRAH